MQQARQNEIDIGGGQKLSWGSGGTVSPPAGPGQSPRGGEVWSFLQPENQIFLVSDHIRFEQLNYSFPQNNNHYHWEGTSPSLTIQNKKRRYLRGGPGIFLRLRPLDRWKTPSFKKCTV